MPFPTRARVAAALGAIAIVAAACGGPTAPAIEDPKEILAQSLGTLQDMKTVHVNATFDGTLPFDPSALFGGVGGNGTGGSIDVQGSNLDADIDAEDAAAQLTFALPSLLNLQGELIVVDEAAYLQVSLLGDDYQKFDMTDAGGLIPGTGSPDPGSPAPSGDPLDEIRKSLDELETPPVKLPDEQCGDTTCYHVQVTLDEEAAEPLASLAPGVAGSGTVDVYVRKNDLRPSRVVLAGDAGEDGDLTATITFSEWDAALDIAAPPADQVVEGEFPGLPGFGD
jgi:hypothetical protein